LPSEAGRLARPVGARDRRFFAGLALLAAASTCAGVLLFGHGGGAPRSTGCLAYDQAGVLGGGTWHLCGGDAAAFCRAHASHDRALSARCYSLSASKRPG
jgi:hypothetical protein